eukprot:4681880-Pyramimonas_sp.AAC.1
MDTSEFAAMQCTCWHHDLQLVIQADRADAADILQFGRQGDGLLQIGVQPRLLPAVRLLQNADAQLTTHHLQVDIFCSQFRKAVGE